MSWVAKLVHYHAAGFPVDPPPIAKQHENMTDVKNHLVLKGNMKREVDQREKASLFMKGLVFHAAPAFGLGQPPTPLATPLGGDSLQRHLRLPPCVGTASKPNCYSPCAGGASKAICDSPWAGHSPTPLATPLGLGQPPKPHCGSPWAGQPPKPLATILGLGNLQSHLRLPLGWAPSNATCDSPWAGQPTKPHATPLGLGQPPKPSATPLGLGSLQHHLRLPVGWGSLQSHLRLPLGWAASRTTCDSPWAGQPPTSLATPRGLGSLQSHLRLP